MAARAVGGSVVVVGAGPAGIRAAQRLVQAGLRPVVLDEGRSGGGQIYRRQPEGFRRPAKALYGPDARKATALHGAFDALRTQLDFQPETLAWAVHDGALLTLRGNEARRIPFDAMILAAGATDRILPVPGWTLPGVFSLGGAQVALKAQACAVGRRPVFLGTGPLLYLVAAQYAKAGVPPAAVLDTSAFSRRLAALPDLAARPRLLARGGAYVAGLRRRGVPVLTGVTPLRLEGDGPVAAVLLRDSAGREVRIACDAVALGFGLRSETQLADLAGCRFAFDPVARHWLPELDADGRSSVPGVYLAGDGAAIRGADAAEMAGRLAACAVLRDRGLPVPDAEFRNLRRKLRAHSRFRRGLEAAFPYPGQLAASMPDATVVCRCETVTAGEIRRAARDMGAAEVNRAKAFSRVGMGRCQGRMCGLAAAEILAAELAVPLQQVGRLRGQAPVKPLPATAELLDA